MIIVHIGLGKTATTTLQKSVFPKVCDIRPNIKYNDKWFIDSCRKHHIFGLGGDALEEIKTYRSQNDLLLSSEAFVN